MREKPDKYKSIVVLKKKYDDTKEYPAPDFFHCSLHNKRG